ncbi:hypothetical protein GCM10025858_17260 [Alicyclobacillus sacchari]|uniref:extracellular solute-binding protein n=1 Tax=Alicyclobacillus sacchari TaxID=392010 RepID=UPI0023E9C8D2|nr:extracellular solute-binding protein [Alicyclobacillus sacchari]GMA57223.1 hypothetical protein GCM10025858_17260 [Alicyclobacillus sacchari]
MNNLRRPLVYLGVTCTAGILATGCGATNSTPSTITRSAAHKSDQSATGAASQTPITIAFWYGVSNNLSNDIQQMVAEFNRTHPNIRVVATYEGSYSGGGEEQQKLLAAIKAGDPPAIAQIEVHAMPLFAASGQLLDLTSRLQTSPIDKPSNFLDGILVSTQYQGRYFGVPFNRSVPVLYYNETLFRQAGIAHPPTNWSQLISDAKALTKGTGNHKIYGFSPLVDWWSWEYAVGSSGGSVLSTNLTKATFAKPNALTILNAQAQLVKDGDAKVETAQIHGIS